MVFCYSGIRTALLQTRLEGEIHVRLRNKKWTSPWLADHTDLVITQDRATGLQGNWQSIFEKVQPLYVEIGTGKGQFIIGMAKKYPEINFIGMEIQEGAVAVAKT